MGRIIFAPVVSYNFYKSGFDDHFYNSPNAMKCYFYNSWAKAAALWCVGNELSVLLVVPSLTILILVADP